MPSIQKKNVQKFYFSKIYTCFPELTDKIVTKCIFWKINWIKIYKPRWKKWKLLTVKSKRIRYYSLQNNIHALQHHLMKTTEIEKKKKSSQIKHRKSSWWYNYINFVKYDRIQTMFFLATDVSSHFGRIKESATTYESFQRRKAHPTHFLRKYEKEYTLFTLVSSSD